MRATKIFSLLSMIIASIFAIVCLLVYPIWSDIHGYLGFRNLPIMQILTLLSIIFAGSVYWTQKSASLAGNRRWIHRIILGVIDAIMLGALTFLFKELGYESIIIFRTASIYLPIAAWVAAVILLIWFGPVWQPLQNWRTHALTIILLGLIAIVYFSLPWKIKLTSRPVVFMQQDGVNITWGTNFLASNLLTYGATPQMSQQTVPQSHGLIDVGELVQNIFLGTQQEAINLYFQAHSVGIQQINPTSAVKAGQAESEMVKVSFPAKDDELFLVAFSDIHEQNKIYKQLAKHIPWEQVDYALYLGDFINHVDEAGQVAEALLSLPTGGVDLPRVFARGNHETRGTRARAFNNWMLPPDGSWYFTFSSGNTFFVVLDSGEDKYDQHVEYSGLVDFASYHREQAKWLAQVFESPDYQNADYRVVLMHIPPIANETPEFEPMMALLENREDIDLMMSGHIHSGGIWLPEETNFPYPITTCGGPLGVDTDAVTVHLKDDGIQLEVVNILGNVVESVWLPAK